MSARKKTDKSSPSANTNSSAATASVAPPPNVCIVLLGENGSVSEKLLKNKIFVLAGLFDEVSSHMMTAEEDIKKMIKSFGGTVNRSFSKNTSEYQELYGRTNHNDIHLLTIYHFSVRLSTRRKES